MIGVLLSVMVTPSVGAEAVAVRGDGVRLEVSRRSPPEFPLSATQPIARCAVRVEIDVTGRPTAATVVGCPEPFATAAERAVLQWRWKAPRVDGAPARGRTVVGLVLTRSGQAIPAPDRCDHAVVVMSDGAVTPREPDPAVACVAAFPDAVAPPPVPLSCTVGLQVRGEERAYDLEGCPAEARAWVEALADHAAFSTAGAHTLTVETAPAGGS